MAQMRVAQIMGKMVGGGVEQVVMNYYRHIDRDAVQFDFIVDEDSTLVPADEIQSLGGRVIEVSPYQYQPKNSLELERLFRCGSWRIVHSHMNALSVIPLRAAKRAGVPIRIAHSHSTWGRGELARNAMKVVLRTQTNRYPTHRMACTRHAGEWLFGKKASFELLPNAVEVGKYQYSPQKRVELRYELGIPEGSFVFGSVGRLVAQKNQSFLLRAFAEAFPSDGGELLILVGEGPDRGMLERLIDELGLAAKVKMLGQRDDMGALYSAMDCFCLPSIYEGLGIVAIEAQISGAQTLISTEVPCDAEITLGARYVPLDKGAWVRSMRLVREQCGRRIGSVEIGLFAPYDIDLAAPLLLEYYQVAADGV